MNNLDERINQLSSELEEAINNLQAHEKDQEFRMAVKTKLGGFKTMGDLWADCAIALKGKRVTADYLKPGVIKKMQSTLDEYKRVVPIKSNPDSGSTANLPKPPDKPKEPTITYLEGNKDVRSEPGTETVIKIEKPKPLLLPAPNINRIESERSKLSQSQDVNKKHSIIITQDSPRIKVWVRDPGKMDVLGVDTPKFVTKIPKPHIPKEPKPKVSRPKIKRKASHSINGIIKHRR